MKKVRHVFALTVAIIALVALISFCAPRAAQAAPAFQGAAITTPEPSPLPPLDLSTVLLTFGSLGGVAVLIAAVVNSLKLLGIKDGDAPAWSAGLNLAALLTVIVLQVLGKTNLVPALDSQAGVFAGILTSIVGLVFQIFVTRKTHEQVLAGLPVIGTSASGRTAGDGTLISIQGDTEVKITGDTKPGK